MNDPLGLFNGGWISANDLWRTTGSWGCVTVDSGTAIAHPGERVVILAPKEKKPMRGLYEVFAVNPESDKVILRDCIVALDDEQAKMQLARRLAPEDDIESLDFIARRIGDVRRKAWPTSSATVRSSGV